MAARSNINFKDAGWLVRELDMAEPMNYPDNRQAPVSRRGCRPSKAMGMALQGASFVIVNVKGSVRKAMGATDMPHWAVGRRVGDMQLRVRTLFKPATVMSRSKRADVETAIV